MTQDRDLSPATGGDDWLDSLLADDARATRDAYIADDGFAARVMHAVALRPALPAWRKPVVAALWGTAAVALAVAMPGTMLEVAREGYRFLATQPVSLAGLAGVAVAMFTLSGAAAAYALRTGD
jgi:hypothetical protein